MSYKIVNIIDMLEMLGEDDTKVILSTFSCVKNRDIERFLHHNAIEFAKKKLSVTYLVLSESGDIAGYFALTHKPAVLGNAEFALLSGESKKKIRRFCKPDDVTGNYTVSAFLIAQLGKNSSAAGDELRGDLLMGFAIDTLKDVQRCVGGGIVFLECENIAKLLAFYENENNRFKRYGTRIAADGKTYLQLLRLF